jgi:hypothetical protein
MLLVKNYLIFDVIIPFSAIVADIRLASGFLPEFLVVIIIP